MIIDKTVKELLQERQELFNRVSPFESVLLENDEGLIADEDAPADQQWYSESDMVVDPQQAEMAPQAAEQQAEMTPQTAEQQAEMAPQTAEQAAEQAEFDLDDLTAMQITQTQEIFTKMYLVKRIEKLKRYIKNLIDLMEMKFDL
ncbi:MAG TPA: hypothetical protein EYP33_00335, partial [Pyrodictium sp.]|nr:hypothetical protein [Pyrodictium sp.]